MLAAAKIQICTDQPTRVKPTGVLNLFVALLARGKSARGGEGS